MDNKYIITTDLQAQIAWDSIMKMDRDAGGHDDQMKGLFRNVEVIAHWNEGDYQGQVATCVKLEDGRYAIYNDYYGSCSGCDSWEDADDEDVRRLCINLSNNAKVFECLDNVVDFLEKGNDEDGGYDWFGSRPVCAKNLLAEIRKGEL